jgi:hypothetical protein
MESPKGYYSVRIGDMTERRIFAVDERRFSEALRVTLNDHAILRGLGDGVEIVYTRPDGTSQQITVGDARRRA